MKISKLTTSVVLLSAFFAAPTLAHNSGHSGYLHDSAGNPVLDSRGECIRTTYWTEENSKGQCGNEEAEMATPEVVVVKAADSDNDGVGDDADQCPGTASSVMVDNNGCAKDSDNDGVSDSADNCPGTASGVMVNNIGCPKDSDNDGVNDGADQCPNTAAGTAVNASGCAKDSDNDGVNDSSDQCPSTAAGIKVDANGCAADSDKDGIIDSSDSCPNTASGAVVNSSGCELKANLSLENLLFDTGTANLDINSQTILNHVARVLEENPHLKFEIAGHTDSSGNYDNNVKLSESRAESVRQYLVDNGVDASRLTAKGYGPDSPVATNDTAEGRRTNRRVELLRLY